MFDQLDKPALKPLPVQPYVYAEWKKCCARLDYHIAIDKHDYSAPCRDGVTVVYKRTPRLFEELELAHGDGRFPRLFRSITKAQLLILDDWGPDRLTATQRHDLMEIVEERYGRGSTMITSQLPIKAWHDVIGEPTFADAMLDRVRHCLSDQWRSDGSLHNAYRIELEGQSMRKTITKMDDETSQT